MKDLVAQSRGDSPLSVFNCRHWIGSRCDNIKRDGARRFIPSPTWSAPPLPIDVSSPFQAHRHEDVAHPGWIGKDRGVLFSSGLERNVKGQTFRFVTHCLFNSESARG